MIYDQIEPHNELPPDLKNDPAAFLEAINTIVDLQNNDPAYRWPAPVHQQRFGTDRTGDQHLDPLALDEAQLTQPQRDGIVGRAVGHALDHGCGAMGQLGQVQALTLASGSQYK